MSGRHLIPVVIMALVLSGCTTDQQNADEPTKLVLPDGVTAGPRFLQQVPLPDHLLTQPTYEDGEEVPGDGHTDGLLKTKRKLTDRSYHKAPRTEGIQLEGLHGTATNPICVCDLTFNFENETGRADLPRLDIIDSSHILVDNVTIYRGSLTFWWSNNVTVTRSQFFDSVGVESFDTDDGHVYDNDFIGHPGMIDPPYDDPPAMNRCWPDPHELCQVGAVVLWSGDRWNIEHNHFDGAFGVSGGGGPTDIHVTHNSFYNGGRILLTDGHTSATWNKIRGWAWSSINIAGSTSSRIENNSIALQTKIDISDEVLDQAPAVDFGGCTYCIVRNNDFIGYGAGYKMEGGGPAMRVQNTYAIADDNYWGSLTDPRTPSGVWIWIIDTGSTIDLTRWNLQPQHPVDEITIQPYPDDISYWSVRIQERYLP